MRQRVGGLNIRQVISSALLSGGQRAGSWLEFIKLGVSVQGSKLPPDNFIVSGLEAGKVLLAIDRLPYPMGALVRFSYGPRDPADGKEVAKYLLLYTVEPSKKWVLLAGRAVQDAALRASSDGSLRFPAEVYHDSMGICQSAFSQVWAARRDGILERLTAMDAEAVDKVRKALR